MELLIKLSDMFICAYTGFLEFYWLSFFNFPQQEHTVAQDPAVDSVKGTVTPVPPAGSDFTEPMDTDSDTTKETDPEAPVAKVPDEKLSSPKRPTSDSSSSSPAHSASSCTDRKQSVEVKDDDIKEETHKADVKKGSACEVKMEVDSGKVEPKKEKTDVGQTAKPSRPSSTPPSDTGMRWWTLLQKKQPWTVRYFNKII